ncbi:periplasmic heavy metal sensor [Telmatospirillum siberiense]|nr:periplasmic heavy metal sensor [Telmatospirillum siberiense]
MRAPPRRRNSVRSILLAVSLGLNLFLAGWEVTQHFGPSPYSKPHPAPETVAEAIANSLPAGDADILRKAFVEKRPALQEAREEYLNELARLRSIITTEPFDRDAFDASMSRMRATRQTERLLFGDTMRDVIPRLSPQGRQAFVAAHMGGRS